jgi:FtsP/CotA-like multicopper oxidase with cupredoxin domain
MMNGCALRFVRGTLLAAIVLSGSIGLRADSASLQPEHWDDNIRLAEAPDRNPDPHIVEVDLEARLAEVEVASGERVQAWTYNGGIPGPLIRVRKGDRLIVHFTNRLAEPTTVHWHGLRVPIAMDGVPIHSQPAVQTGGSFTYDFVTNDAGLFWYHPHVMSAAQVGFGLYGALLVEDPDEQVGVRDELVMVLSDIATDGHGHFEPPDSGGPAGMVFGREGNHVLVNGRSRPVLQARNGAPQRWRIVNAAKSRYFNLELEGQTFTRIGGDGGLQELPDRSDELVLAPGERADVIVTPRAKDGQPLVLRSLLFNRGYGSVEFRDIEDLIAIEMAPLPEYTEPVSIATHRTIEALEAAGATPVQIDFTLAQKTDGTFEYGINGVPFSKGPIPARVGETQLWTVKNTTKWSHPFHLHGFFFQVLDDRGNPVRPMAWKDTVNVPFEQTVRLLVRFDDRPGQWMFHCHILDHADGGLMGTVALGVPADTPPVNHVH